MKIQVPHFSNKADLFRFLKKNIDFIIAQKKSVDKHADVVDYYCETTGQGGVPMSVSKAIADPSQFSGKQLNAKLVINTTNILDSHGDVHIPGLWNKSLKENKKIYLLQEHQMSFDHIIADGIKASAEMINWKDLGYKAEGQTQALIFSAEIKQERNPFMFDQYVKGYVTNHSVGMRYVTIALALNSDSKYDVDEKKVWDKYIGQIVNAADAEEQGYFFAVTEAKIVEGSAVPIGSNKITPVLNIEAKREPSEDTSKDEPEKSTQKINYEILTNGLKNLKLN